MWRQIRRRVICSLIGESCCFNPHPEHHSTHRDPLASSTRAQRTNKVCHSLAFWQVIACMWEFVMCVRAYDSLWVTCCPPGCTARAMQKGFCVSVCLRRRGECVDRPICMHVCTIASIHLCVRVSVCVCLSRGAAQTWTPPPPHSDDSRLWLPQHWLFLFQLSKSMFF